jgi:putative spermidine/putrescine transport system ATP-binding protein
MSDRIAVFNLGKIEQMGTPADVYERPATSFVAGFVGTSNLITGETALHLISEPIPFSVRPEKIRISAPDAATPDGSCGIGGMIRDVVYLGVHTRYLVELDDGTDLTVIEQNLETTSMSVLAAKGRRVKLIWQREHNHFLALKGSV